MRDLAIAILGHHLSTRSHELVLSDAERDALLVVLGIEREHERRRAEGRRPYGPLP